MDLDHILRCPRCRAPLTRSARGYECGRCRVVYPVADGIANFTPTDALPLPDEQPLRNDPDGST